MKMEVRFNTVSGPQVQIYSREELVGYDLLKIFDSLQSQHASGVIGATYDLPAYGRIECNLVED